MTTDSATATSLDLNLVVDRRTDHETRWHALAARRPDIAVTHREASAHGDSRADVRATGSDALQTVIDTITAFRDAGILVVGVRNAGQRGPDGYRPLFAVAKQAGEWMRDRDRQAAAERRRLLAEEPDPTPSDPAPQDALDRWVDIAKADTWIGRAVGDTYDASWLTHCATLAELAERLDHGNWGTGCGFYYHDLCLIQREDGGDEYLAIRHGHPFESVTTRGMIERGEFGPFVRRLLAATEDQVLTSSY